MHIIYTIFISMANNVDNISVRIAYSIRGVKISVLKNLWISVITFLISSFAASFGNIVSRYLSKGISSVISMVLLTAIGLWIIFEPCLHRENKAEKCGYKDKSIYNILTEPEEADLDNSKHIDFKEATFLGIALSINNIGGGLSAGMIGINAFLVGFFSALISFLALWAGNFISDFFMKWNLGKKATIAAGVILIIIGIKQIL